MTTPAHPVDPNIEGSLNNFTAAGFKEVKNVDVLQQWCDDAGMSTNGPYKIHHVLNKGDVWVRIEQNNAPEDFGGGMFAQLTYPPVCVVQGTNGSAALNDPTVELINDTIAALS